MRTVLKGLLIVFSGYILLLFGMYSLQEKLIFLPTKLPQEHTYTFKQPFTEIFLEAKDGARLNALHFKVENPKGVMLYFHGNAGNLDSWGDITSFFTQFEYDVLVMDYRTYGKSTGNLSEKTLYKDAQLFYDYLLKQYAEDEITVYGRSLGTALAAYVAANNHPKKLILETPFYAMADLAKKRFPILPVKQLLRYKFPTNTFLKKTSCPVVIFHGTEDGVVPYSSGKKLAKEVSIERLDFITLPQGDHNNLIEFKAYRKGIAKALQ
ncbi:alpha/beta hydrolase [Marixanthomonas spongiae]|uniref:Alpha/beta hydrolase n=1 Tax=Marixanthomonas spongiae TaxID=2174845 RepID=A0A2U0HY89_9FLAO|nr:alpha/beta hydrolase [Marixanthomonas spongiae]PVW13841.1 alpha/beta hydrolase [Marixanthomonas spongiae]